MFPLAHQWSLLPKNTAHSFGLGFPSSGEAYLLFGVGNDFVPVEGPRKPLFGVCLFIGENSVSESLVDSVVKVRDPPRDGAACRAGRNRERRRREFRLHVGAALRTGQEFCLEFHERREEFKGLGRGLLWETVCHCVNSLPCRTTPTSIFGVYPFVAHFPCSRRNSLANERKSPSCRSEKSESTSRNQRLPLLRPRPLLSQGLMKAKEALSCQAL